MSTILPGGLRVLVSGAVDVSRNSNKIKGERVLEFCHALGASLAASTGEIPVVLITGGRGEELSADRAVIEGVRSVLQATDLSKRVVTFPAPQLRQDLNEVFDNTRVIPPRGSTRQSRRFQMVRSADIVISIAGSVGAPEAIHLAQALEIPSLPLLFTGGGSAGKSMKQAARDFGLHEDELKHWQQEAGKPRADLVPFAERVAQLVRVKAILRCFIAMPYGAEDIEDFYKNFLVPALRDAAFRPIRSDEQQRPGIILTQMLDDIHNSAAMVAILTDGRYRSPSDIGLSEKASLGVNPNVMYEVGYARALEIPTILISKQPESLPFDLKVDRTIDMDQEAPLIKETVTDVLRSVRLPELSN